MRDHGKWNIAIARLAQFIANLPQSPNEVHVSKFHDIVQLLQEASGQNLSRFRIAPDRIQPRTDFTIRSSFDGVGRARGTAQYFVEPSHFRSQVGKLVDHVGTVRDDVLHATSSG